MKKTCKASRNRAFDEGAMVRSLREQDDGATGVIVKCSKKQKGWEYTVCFDGWYKLAVRREAELEEIV